MNAERLPPREGADITILLNIEGRLSIIETQNANIIGEQDEAKKSRSLMHDKQDELSADIKDVSAIVKRIEPQVADHEKLRQQLSGGATVMVALGSILMLAVGFVFKDLWAWIGGHLHWK